MATVFTDKRCELFSPLAVQQKQQAGGQVSKHAVGLHSRLQRTRGPGWAADRWLCCLGCLLLWPTTFGKGLAQWRGSRIPVGLSGSGSWLWSGSADRPSWHPPPQCLRFDIPCLSTWGCVLSVPLGHRLQKAGKKKNNKKNPKGSGQGLTGYIKILDEESQENASVNGTSHRVTLGPADHLPVVQPLGRKHLVEPPKRELPLLEDARQPAGSKAPQAPLQPQLMLLLRPELPSTESPHHRAAAAPPLLGMTR